MKENSFKEVGAFQHNPLYKQMIERLSRIYQKAGDIRSEFGRDYTRILHCPAYRRLKSKTQVFYNAAGNDHVCTRIEHVAHVESVAGTIGQFLGLNTELIKAIAMAHDLGHAPFGHEGERAISRIMKEKLGKLFWHERHGLRIVDEVELLEDDYKRGRNLDLTYAVRDGIISHCGEVDEKAIIPRKEAIDLRRDYTRPGEYPPFTWEGAVVKISDKIAYLGRDIEDALNIGILNSSKVSALNELVGLRGHAINTTVITHNMILDICENSSPEAGITLSAASMEALDTIKKFNYENIYHHHRLKPFVRYAELVINELFRALCETYDGKNTFYRIKEEAVFYPELMGRFGRWLVKYVSLSPELIEGAGFKPSNDLNKKVCGNLEDEAVFMQAVLDYIAGMTDRYAIHAYEELLKY
ncbi:MAG: HD domain-containing protein [Lachnospiraceae bacterium]|nr:HD domain-containing protein [Lachnospiraceae bacterium]